MKSTDRYMKIVEWSPEDDSFVGSCPPLIGRCCHGKNELAVYRQLSKIVEEWGAHLKKTGQAMPRASAGKKYSGKFVMRIPPTLHQALAALAANEGTSLNAYLSEVLRDVATHR